MSIISAGDTGGVDLPEISNSLRFDGSNDYLSRTFTAQSSATTKTISIWFKRSKSGAQQYIFSNVLDGNNFGGVYINSSDKLCFYAVYTASVQVNKVSTQVLRDPSAWQHLVVQMDTTQATATDRVKLLLNNVQVTAFDTNSVPMAQNATVVAPFTLTNSTWVTLIGQAVSANYLDGYVANVCLVDNAVKTPSDFAYTDPNGQWRSLSKTALQSVVNAGGTASFFLPFDDGSSTTTLGNDASSKGNNWTLTNMVRASGATDCWSFDTPTNNFSTLNPLHAGRSTITNGALTASGATDLPTIIPDGGTWYFEINGVSKTWTPPAAFPASAGDYNFGQRAFSNTATNPTLSTKNLPDGSVTTSGSFTGNVAADGPFVWINGTPTAMTINGNAVTFGTHADKLANGFKLRTASTSYNNSGSNTYSVTSNAGAFKYNNAEGNP